MAELLRYAGKGSLYSYLRRKQWISTMDAGTDRTNKIFSLFSINLNLTEDGCKHLNEVLSATFSYLKFVKRNGPYASIYRDIQSVKANGFRFAEEKERIENVEQLAMSMHQYSPEHILNGDHLYFEYNADIIQNFIDELNSRKFNIMITSMQPFYDRVTFDLVEPWYGTKYAEIDMPTEWIDQWENVEPFSEFTVPEPNPFITNDFTISTEAGSNLSKYPIRILDNDLCELWFRQDDKFMLPIARYHFHLMSPYVLQSTKE